MVVGNMASCRAWVEWFLVMAFLGPCAAETLGGFGDFVVTYVPSTVSTNDQAGELALTMTNTSGYANGAGIEGLVTYMYGSFSVKMKLINGQQDSSGTVCSFYLTSELHGRSNWDEIDLEFLGNRSGEPLLLHTNLWIDGTGQREQRFEFWFDPTEDYHTYGMIWNHNEIVWLIDDTPVRAHFNTKDPSSGVQNVFPSRPVVAAASIFEASQWATQGGGVPINPSAQPWTVNYKDFEFQGCVVSNGDESPCEQNYQTNWWETSWDGLTSDQKSTINRIRNTYMVSDYCKPDWYNYNPTLSGAECNANDAMLA